MKFLRHEKQPALGVLNHLNIKLSDRVSRRKTNMSRDQEVVITHSITKKKSLSAKLLCFSTKQHQLCNSLMSVVTISIFTLNMSS